MRRVLLFVAIAIAAGRAVAQGTDPAVIGQWSSTFTLPIVPIHSNLLTTGQVLIFDSATDSTSPPRLFYPSTLSTLPVPYQDSTNIFCSDSAPLTDGRVLVVGGHVPPGYVGINNATIFDPTLNTWTDVAPMTYARWYPSLIRLSDGRMLVISGAINCSDCTSPTASHLGIADLPEIFDPRDGTWTTISNASLRLPLYPYVYVLPDGRIFAAASQEEPIVSQVLNLTTGTWTTVDAAHKLDGGSSVMYLPGKIMKSGSARNPDYQKANASANTYVIDMNQPSPAWRQTASMANPRTQHNLVVLPDGTVLAIGGGRNSDVNSLNTAILAAELWNPDTETWSTLSSGQVPRLYHSTALLLPDGTVFVGGGGHPPGFGVAQYDAEIFSPPYLFNGSRPTITSVPSLINYGHSFFLQTPDSDTATRVALIAQGTVTHSFNSNQRYLSLAFTQTSGGLDVSAPANANLAPPGNYMMFLLNSSGVPSLASWVRLPAFWEDSQAPSGPTSLVASATMGKVSLAWGASSDNVGVTGYDVYRSTSSGFVPTAANRVGQPATSSYADTGMDSGTYYYVVRARDAFGNLSPSSNEVFATVVADTTAPDTTSGLIVAYAGAGQINLAWGVPADDVGVADYRVERCTGSECASFVQVGKPGQNAFDDVGLTAGTTYSYRVRAEDARENLGGYSDVVTGTTGGPSGGLVAALGFNDGTGATAVDISGIVNNGLLNGANWTAGGKFGGALLFDGTSALVNVNDSPSLQLTTAMTVEAWVKPSAVSNVWRDVIYKGVDNYYLEGTSDSGGRPAMGGTFSPTPLYGTAPLTQNAWSHLAATYDGATRRLFVNGQQVVSDARTGAIQTSTNPLQIGGDTIYAQYFRGTIDEVRIYNRALAAAEIQIDMNTPVERGIVQFSLGKDSSSGSILLLWTDSASTGSFRVRRATGPAPADFSSATCFIVSGTTFTDPAPAANGVSYDYLVDAGGSCP